MPFKLKNNEKIREPDCSGPLKYAYANTYPQLISILYNKHRKCKFYMKFFKMFILAA